MRYVVVGLHAAGRSACQWLRRADPACEIVGVDPSAGSLYARPLISYVLDGELPEHALVKDSAPFFENLGVQLKRAAAVGLDANRKRLILDSGEELAYDKLLAATGSAPRRVRLEGDGADHVCYFRGQADLARILAHVKSGGVAAVLGGGLVGFKLTHGLVARGMKVKLMVTSPRPLALNVDEYVGSWAGARFKEMDGVHLMTSTSVVRADVHGQGLRLTLDDGSTEDVDLVVAGKGVVPRFAWLAEAGPETDQGLLVDNRLMTSVEDVYAAGDAVQASDIVHERPLLNAIWPNAVEQGRVAALNMAAKGPAQGPAYAGSIAMNAIPIFGTHMVSVGMVNPRYTEGCEFITTTCHRGSYLNIVIRDGVIVGAVGLSAVPRLGELAHAVRTRMKVSRIPARWLKNPRNAAPLAGNTPWYKGSRVGA
ncbi:MAG: FAD-dependent oxidoreductase [Desulfovibrionaceae bacterium]|nr:FAD-dependent oxidoreductase [Desulfovibrionaceae bacterium]